MKINISKKLNWVAGLVFPSRCAVCSKLSVNDGEYLCRSCFSELPVRGSFECIGCKAPTSRGLTCAVCAHDYAVNQLFIVSDYSNKALQQCIKTLKYRRIPSLADYLSALARKYIIRLNKEKHINIFAESPILIPIPLYRTRVNDRGFNQAELIAKDIADSYQLKMQTDIIKRTKKTAPQADLEDKEERLLNVAGIFAKNGHIDIEGQNILLVDDVCTTGATLNECAKVLKSAGAKFISALVIARG